MDEERDAMDEHRLGRNDAGPEGVPNGLAREATSPKPSPRPGRARNAAGKDSISAGLRQLWADVEKEPVPDDFLQMLDSIDAARTGKSSGSAK